MSTRRAVPDRLTLADEIRADHGRILDSLGRLASDGEIDDDHIESVLVTIGAHHLAEEETLYAALDERESAAIGQARAYHVVLDELVDSIQDWSFRDEPVRHRIELLKNLMRQHFEFEEERFLDGIDGLLPVDEQDELGTDYRRRCGDYRQILKRRFESRRQTA